MVFGRGLVMAFLPPKATRMVKGWPALLPEREVRMRRGSNSDQAECSAEPTAGSLRRRVDCALQNEGRLPKLASVSCSRSEPASRSGWPMLMAKHSQPVTHWRPAKFVAPRSGKPRRLDPLPPVFCPAIQPA